MLLFVKYVEAAMSNAQYEVIEEGNYWAAIPGFNGVWGTGKTIEASRADLEDWLFLGLWLNDEELPEVAGISLVPRHACTGEVLRSGSAH